VKPLAVECYADLDVFHFLRDTLRVPLRKFHAFSQGEVVNRVVVRQRAELGRATLATDLQDAVTPLV
jgi:hypothetical protein